MKLLLDTHILVWWVEDSEHLSQKYAKLLDEADSGKHEIFISIISLWEIANLVSLEKIKMSISLDEWFEQLETDPSLSVLPLSASIVLESTRLGPRFHKDPAGQLLVATARCHGLKLLTADDRILKSDIVSCVR